MELSVAPVDVTLWDGETITIADAGSATPDELKRFVDGLSPASRRLRFFAATAKEAALEELLREGAQGAGACVLVARTSRAEIIAHAVMFRVDEERAEVAFTVSDSHHGKGIGTILLGRLAEIADQEGIAIFEAFTLPENAQMIDVFQNAGFPTEVRWEDGMVCISFPTAFSQEALSRFEERDCRATVSSLERVLRPRSLAVAGVSRSGEGIGAMIARHILDEGYTGEVALLHHEASELLGRPAYRSLGDVPFEIDLVIVAVPAEHVLDVARDAAHKGAKGLVVISAGFSENGTEQGKARQAELLAIARNAGMRLVGPNCLGIITTDPDVRLHATFGPQLPIPGNVAFLSQSGALGLAVMDFSRSLGIGISSFLSVGNKADVSGNDMLQYWESDARTDALLLYLESFGNARKFARIARRVSAKKPIVVVKGGRSSAGARAAGSHTGALVGTSSNRMDALYERAGVIGTDTLEEMFDIAAVIASQPPPRGSRVAIVTNAGGPAILCADACAAHGLDVPPLSTTTTARLRELLGPNAGVANPIDLLAEASAQTYRQALDIVTADDGVDAVIAVYIPPFDRGAEEVVRVIAQAGAARRKPIVGAYLSPNGRPHFDDLPHQAPILTFAESAALALAKYAKYARNRSSGAAKPARLDDMNLRAVGSLIAHALDAGGGWMAATHIDRLFAAAGIPRLAVHLARTPAEVAAITEDLGTAVALKAISPGVLHKTEAGAVRIGLEDAEAAAAAARTMERRLAAAGHGIERFLVQPMAPQGVEMFVGTVRDTVLGPLVVAGAGGTAVEIVNDVALRLAGLDQDDPAKMVSELRCAPLLRGYRGSPPCDQEAYYDIVRRIDRLVTRFPSIAEIDCNPIVVYEKGACVVDARIRIEPAPLPSSLGR